ALSGMSGQASRAEGTEFSVFDGHVTGRQIELVPGQRIVQAWRFPAWGPGRYSVVRFSLAPEDGGTPLVIDQPGAPVGEDTLGCHPTWHDHLETNWPVFYAAPLTRHLAGCQLTPAAGRAACPGGRPPALGPAGARGVNHHGQPGAAGPGPR